MNRSGSRSSMLVLIALLCLSAVACAGNATNWSVTVGMGIPAPWGAVTIATAVPMGYGW
jgi:hypothetical protein